MISLANHATPMKLKMKITTGIFSPFEPIEAECGSKDGNHLGFLYYSILEHIANSYLEPPSLSQYMAKMMVGRKSTLEKASGD